MKGEVFFCDGKHAKKVLAVEKIKFVIDGTEKDACDGCARRARKIFQTRGRPILDVPAQVNGHKLNGHRHVPVTKVNIYGPKGGRLTPRASCDMRTAIYRMVTKTGGITRTALYDSPRVQQYADKISKLDGHLRDLTHAHVLRYDRGTRLYTKGNAPLRKGFSKLTFPGKADYEKESVDG